MQALMTTLYQALSGTGVAITGIQWLDSATKELLGAGKDALAALRSVGGAAEVAVTVAHPAALHTARFRVRGMSCAACVVALEGAVARCGMCCLLRYWCMGPCVMQQASDPLCRGYEGSYIVLIIVSQAGCVFCAMPQRSGIVFGVHGSAYCTALALPRTCELVDLALCH